MGMGTMKKRENRGGRRKGAGLKTGTPYKNAKKVPEERHKHKKTITYTQKQFNLVCAAMKKQDSTQHTVFARVAVLNYSAWILAEGEKMDVFENT